MFIEPPGSKIFSTDLSSYSIVGFHATSSAVAANIERVGFLPDKILNESELNELLELAQQLGMDTKRMGGFEEWLTMKSVTFTKEFKDAMNHVNTARYEGQGRQHIHEILDKAIQLPDPPGIVARIKTALSQSQSTNPVIYAVDLSSLGERLTEPSYKNYYQIFWDQNHPIPSESIVGPQCLIARLDL